MDAPYGTYDKYAQLVLDRHARPVTRVTDPDTGDLLFIVISTGEIAHRVPLRDQVQSTSVYLQRDQPRNFWPAFCAMVAIVFYIYLTYLIKGLI